MVFANIATNGYKTPNAIELVGRISMDNSSFLSSSDEILIFDDARVISKYAKTISYEVLTSLKPEINRRSVNISLLPIGFANKVW